ncbi:hypothetical protein [Actinoplanes sp. NPDC026670]|uniref:ABC transporter substrate-binding protein n=1 Tax=Actinoplanes sp. NPDC026670 TaxID=3154700 RepID=UPI0033CA909F
MKSPMRRLVAVTTVATMLTLTACSGEDGTTEAGDTTAVQVGNKWTGGPVTVDLWHDNKAIQPAVDAFNAAHSAEGIQIKFTETTELNTAVRNAFAAGNAPDLFVTQTADLASFISEGIAADVSRYYQSIAADYAKTVNEAVTTGGRQWAVPAASIPTFMLYNSRVFQANGVKYPTTYEEVLEAGKALKPKNVSIMNVAGEDPTPYIYMAWEAGARWYRLDGDAWTVNVDSEQTRRSAEFFDKGLADGIFSKISYAEYAAMMQQYDSGAIAARQLSTWQTKGMQANLKTSLGSWDPEPNLKWNGNPATNAAFTRVFTTTSKSDAADAAVFAAHALSSTADTINALGSPVTGLSYFPAVADPKPYIASSLPDKLLGANGKDWEPVVTQAVSEQADGWTYGPNWAGAFSQLQDLWGKAVAGQMKAVDIAPALQKWIVDDLKQQGIGVAGA